MKCDKCEWIYQGECIHPQLETNKGHRCPKERRERMTELKPCEARVKYQKEPGGKIFDHKCCLYAPHNGFKHFDPVLLITMGGERVTHDIYGNDITHSWSPYSNENID